MAQAPGPSNIPRATLRLQFNKDFGFDRTAELIPYFAALGISHIYASPFLQARAGSSHGYDITDHAQFNPEVGDAASFDRMIEILHAHGMGLILDFVPNHMGIGGSDNGWWLDVLEWGQTSPFAPFFDINWLPAEIALRGKVLLPFLGDHYGNVLEKGELELKFDAAEGAFSVWYYSHRFPIAVRHYPQILKPVIDALGDEGRDLTKLIQGFRTIGTGSRSVARQAMVRREAQELKRQLATLVAGNQVLRAELDRTLDRLNGVPGRSETFTDLHALLEQQAYRVAFWRVAADEINYRRFFDINDLAGLRMERPELFELAHQLVFRLIAEGKLQGLRMDHIDGLYDPVGYCERLQERVAYLLHQNRVGGFSAPDAPALRLRHPLYLLVEKILARHEHLRDDWPVSGTTGYEFMNLVNGLTVESGGEAGLRDAYLRFVGREIEFDTVVVEAKRRVVTRNLVSELNVLSVELYRLAQQNWSTRDYTLTGIRNALIDVVAYFPVYRTYVTPSQVSEEDRRYIDWAISLARKSSELPDTSIYDFLAAALTTDLARDKRPGYRRADVYRTAMKFQQFTGPVTAKAVEDTAFYRYVLLISLNEVGGEPSRFGTSPAAFHHLNQERLRRHPFSLLATATHDHKRGEDARARINVLSEVPGEWGRRARRWAQLNRYKKREIDGRPAPGRNDEYLLYQTLVGAWPLDLDAADAAALGAFADRIVAYMIKAVREAKERSSWAAPNADYEAALERFVRGVLDAERSAGFLHDLADFRRRTDIVGAVNGLAQTLLKLTVPGVPDIYQGTDYWDFSLVDPDNRRPVDYAARRCSLADRSADAARMLADWRNGRIKQHVVARALDLRRRDPVLFGAGDYLPVDVVGDHAARIVAFVRRYGSAVALTVVPRLVTPLLDGADRPMPDPGGWGDTALLLSEEMVGKSLSDVMTDRKVRVPREARLRVADLLSDFPVALLSGRPEHPTS